MSEATLTRERILDAAEDALTRFGPQKATVVDVARALGVSHGSVYRHFPSKAALRDAVTERWLSHIGKPLAKIVSEKGSASERLHKWFLKLIAIKRQKAKAEPELFATYQRILGESREVIRAHIDMLVSQLSRIIADGIKSGEFVAVDPDATGRAMFYSTLRFHAPAYATEWSDPGIDAAFQDLWALLMRGLTSPSSKSAMGKRRA